MTAPLDEARLRELAEAATQGEWKACGTIYEYMNCEIRSGRKGEGQAIAQVWDGPNAFRDGQHIAACSPATILALLDALSAERKRGDRAVKALERAADDMQDIGRQSPKPSNSADPEHENYLRRVLISLAQVGNTRARQALATQSTSRTGEG